VWARGGGAPGSERLGSLLCGLRAGGPRRNGPRDHSRAGQDRISKSLYEPVRAIAHCAAFNKLSAPPITRITTHHAPSKAAYRATSALQNSDSTPPMPRRLDHALAPARTARDFRTLYKPAEDPGTWQVRPRRPPSSRDQAQPFDPAGDWQRRGRDPPAHEAQTQTCPIRERFALLRTRRRISIPRGRILPPSNSATIALSRRSLARVSREGANRTCAPPRLPNTFALRVHFALIHINCLKSGTALPA
jgi:hypothetical protein